MDVLDLYAADSWFWLVDGKKEAQFAEVEDILLPIFTQVTFSGAHCQVRVSTKNEKLKSVDDEQHEENKAQNTYSTSTRRPVSIFTFECQCDGMAKHVPLADASTLALFGYVVIRRHYG